MAVGVEVGAEPFGVFGGEGSGDGPAADFAGPGRVGAVQLRGVGVAVASGALAAGGAVGERAGQDQADLAEFGLDLLVPAGRGRPWSQESLSAALAASPACMLEVTIFQVWPGLAEKMRRARACACCRQAG